MCNRLLRRLDHIQVSLFPLNVVILGSLLNCFCVTVDGMALNCVTVLRFAIRWKDATNVFNLIEFYENPFSFIWYCPVSSELVVILWCIFRSESSVLVVPFSYKFLAYCY